jgi:glycosyltransferase involved in cell wall biosynthesis
MRIGIVPCLDPGGGGVYQYCVTVLRALQASVKAGMKHDFVVFTDQPDHWLLSDLDRRFWKVKPLQPTYFVDRLRRLVGEGPHRELWRLLRHRGIYSLPAISHTQVEGQWDPDSFHLDKAMHKWFRHCGVELMFYSSPYWYPLEAAIPFILPVHDIQHRMNPEFPEVSANGECEKREYFYRNGARYAALLLVDSEIGREDIIRFYGECGVDKDRVRVLPFLPACDVSIETAQKAGRQVRELYSLPERFLFYPAQFWPHKNHLNLVRALNWIKQNHGFDVQLVLCGSHTGELREQTFSEVQLVADRLGVLQQIHYLGYVDDAAIAGLYKEAVALVMPTYFGPTNIPVVEAWSLGCPVLTSDVRGIREQVGDAGLLADPRSAEDLARAMLRLWTDRELCLDLIRRGKLRQAAYTPEHFQQRLAAIIEDGVLRVRQGVSPKFPSKIV